MMIFKNSLYNSITISIVIFFLILGTAKTKEPNSEYTCPAAIGLPTLSVPERLTQMPQFLIPGYWTVKVLFFIGQWNPFKSRFYLENAVRNIQVLIRDDEDKGCYALEIFKKRSIYIFDKPAGLYFFHYFASPAGASQL